MELTIEQALQQGVAAHKDGKLQDAERLYRAILHSQPTHPDANHNLGVLAVSVKKADMALPLFKTALEANPKIEKFWLSYIDALIKEKQNEVAKQVLEQAKKQGVAGKKLAEAHNNLGNMLKELGRLDEAEASYTIAIALKPDFAEAHNNLGITLKELGRLDEAETSYTQAIALKPDYAVAFWNLHGIQKTIQGAEHWIDKCLIADTNHVKARLTKAALRFYQGDSNSFDGLMQSEFKQHPYMRSFSWAFSLPNLPELHFDKWYFFDAIVKKSIISKPFYEFGVWRASSFKYLIKVFKKGYGFDTFTGLPEDWDVGSHVEKKGTYTSDENVPNIKGGEFIVGKFEDTLPVFFSESRPIASVINFDADLYSSTICALNFSKSVMDKDTILIFDELIINKSWEQDEFKALNEFCSINHCSYEVIAISFFTKQVAVKLIGI
jgi:tetratricopeptide (TPR) repeat protein